MLQTIDGFADDVVAIRGVGRITGDDYRSVLIPEIERATQGGGKVRLLFELAEGYEGYDAGAMFADASFGMRHLGSFERIAIVTDLDWLRHATTLFGPLIPGEVRVFGTTDRVAAHDWIRD